MGMYDITLTLGDRIILANAIIQKEMDDWDLHCKQWLVNEFRTYRFISRDGYGEITDDRFHQILDQKKVPRKVDANLWHAYVYAKE